LARLAIAGQFASARTGARVNLLHGVSPQLRGIPFLALGAAIAQSLCSSIPAQSALQTKSNIMSKKATAAPAETSARLDAFTVREYEQNNEKKSDWSKVGVAFPHQDGKGYRVVLTSLPVDGVLVLRYHEPKAD
jgi:hypothetical protein